MSASDWNGVVTASCSVLALLGGAIGTVWIAFRRFCSRIDRFEDRVGDLEQQLAAHGQDTGRRLDELGRDMREVRSWLLNGRGPAPLS
jgi:hypothetical protein